MEEKPTQSREGVKGGTPLRGQGAELPCGVWGNAPTVPRATSISNALNKRRRQRSVPASNFALPQERPQAALPTACTLSRQMGATTQPLHHTLPLLFPSKRIPKPKKIQEKPAAQNRWLFQSPEIFTSSAPPDESAGTSARSPQTRTSWGAVHAARDSAPTGRSKAECSAPATIG